MVDGSLPTTPDLGGIHPIRRSTDRSDLRNEPDFLNRTGRLTNENRSAAISYICVPIKIQNRTAGALP